MSSGIVAIMLATSLLMGLVGLIGFIWGLKTGQFDDEKKMCQGILFDSPSDLQEALEKKNTENSTNTAKNQKNKG